MRRLILVVPIVLAAACAVRPVAQPARAPAEVPATQAETPAQASERRAQAPRPAYNLSGYPPAVRDGYIDGCETAKRSSYGRKDAGRMASDSQYAMGWNDGFSICQRR
jgi:hypothetical protein